MSSTLFSCETFLTPTLISCIGPHRRPGWFADGNITPRELRPFYEPDRHPIVAAAAVAWSQEVQIRRLGRTPASHDPLWRNGPVLRGLRHADGAGTSIRARPAARGHRHRVFDLARHVRVRFLTSSGEPSRSREGPGKWSVSLRPISSSQKSQGSGTDEPRNRGTTGSRRGTGDSFACARAAVVTCSSRSSARHSPGAGTRPGNQSAIGARRTTVPRIRRWRPERHGQGPLWRDGDSPPHRVHQRYEPPAVAHRRSGQGDGVARGHWRETLARRPAAADEAVVLAVFGGALGLAAAVAGVQLLLRNAPPELPRLDTVPIDGSVLTFAVALLCSPGLSSGSRPRGGSLGIRLHAGERSRTWYAGRSYSTSAAEWARRDGDRLGRAPDRRRRSSSSELFQPHGYQSRFQFGSSPDVLHVLTGRTEFTLTRAPEVGGPRCSARYQPLANFLRELQERIQGLPGVEAVASTSSLPLAAVQYDPLTVFHLVGEDETRAKEAALSARTRG